MSDSESIINCNVQVLYKKAEEKRSLSELVIADLAIPGNLWEILDMLQKLGEVYLDQGRYMTAVHVVTKLVEGHRSRLGNSSDDANMLNALRLLGCLLCRSASYAQAESLARRALRGQSVLGRDDQSTRNTITDLGDLGIAMSMQDKFEEAGSVCRQAMEGAERLYGPKHRYTMWAARRLELVVQIEMQSSLGIHPALSRKVQGSRGDAETGVGVSKEGVWS